MGRRNWKGNPRCSFCLARETSNHLFFGCSVAKVVWRTVASVFGTDLCPTNSWQFFSWCYIFIPDGERFYTMGLAAICWSIWSYRNRATFEFKQLGSPFDIVYTAVVFLKSWAGLLKNGDGELLIKGADLLKDNASKLLRICNAVKDGAATRT